MKIAALFLFPLTVFAAVPPTQEEVQATFDAAVSSADKMVISAVSISPATESRKVEIAFVPVWETTEIAEISPLSRYFRLKIPFPNPTQMIVDGKEVPGYREASFGGYPSFTVTLKKKDAVLLFFAVFGRDGIGCEALGRGGLWLDRNAVAPFYSTMTERVKKAANQPPEPTAPSGRGSP